MQLLFFAAQYLPTAGGVERYTQSLAAALVAMGHGATVVTSALPGLPEEETGADGIHVVRLPARLFMRGRFPAPRKNADFARLSAALWSQRWDYAIINTRFYPLSLWAAGQCKRRGIPALVVEHGTKHLSLDNTVLNWAGNLYEHAMMRLVRRRCDDFYGVSQACNQWLRHFHVEARGVLYNAVDAGALDAIVQSEPVNFRERFGIDGGAPLICFVGRLILEKGVWVLLDAMALLREKLPEATLIMAGDGPLMEALAAKNAPGVHLAGALPYAETIALLAQADLFCLPTYSEGFSSTILEATAVGACIITTPTGGSPELISDGESGILLRDRDPKTVCDAMLYALQHTRWRQQAGQRARQTVTDKFTWPKTAEKLLAIATPKTNTKEPGT